MEKKLAEFLAKETIRGYGEMPLREKETIVLNEQKLTQILEEIIVRPISKRMRFFSYIPESERTFYDSTGSARKSLKIVGVITNYDTGYTPGYIVQKFREKEEKAEEELEHTEDLANMKNLNPNEIVLCRKLREDEEIIELKEKSLKAGYKYSTFAEYSISRSIRDTHDGGELWWKMPLVFIPGVNQKDARTIINACLRYQVPAVDISDDWFVDKVVLSD